MEQQFPKWKKNSFGSGLAVTALILAGCVTKPSPVVSQYFDLDRETSVEVRVDKGPVHLGYLAPKSKAEGAAQMAGEMARGAAASPYGVFVLPMLPLAALVGAVRGVPPEEVSRSERALTNLAAQTDINRDLAREIIRLGNQLTSYHWTLSSSSVVPQRVSRPATNVLVLELSVLARRILKELFEAQEPRNGASR